MVTRANKETESQTDDKATESVNSAENNTEDSTQSSTENSTENQNGKADTEQLTARHVHPTKAVATAQMVTGSSLRHLCKTACSTH